jgi:predicted HTH transcriptional regulator
MRTHEAFARFVAEEARAGRRLELDDLIALRAATDRGFVDRWSAEERLQLSEEEAAARLIALRARGYLAALGRGRGTTYRLVRHLSDRLRGPGEAEREIPLDTEALRLRIQAVLAERGRVTNADIRRLSGYSRGEVLRLMRALTQQGIANTQGRGRAAHYIPGPRVPLARSPQRRGRK